MFFEDILTHRLLILTGNEQCTRFRHKRNFRFMTCLVRAPELAQRASARLILLDRHDGLASMKYSHLMQQQQQKMRRINSLLLIHDCSSSTPSNVIENRFALRTCVYSFLEQF